MLIRLSRFNLYLLALAFLLAVCGCKTTKQKLDEQTAVFRVHLEDRSYDTNRCLVVPIYRSAPVQIGVQRAPFLTEKHVVKATVIDTMGGFQLQIQMNRQGSYLLEQYTSGNPDKHLAIFCNFTTLTNTDVHLDRWLAAPRINHRMVGGVLTFTPDATREETDHIAISLNNTAKKLETADK